MSWGAKMFEPAGPNLSSTHSATPPDDRMPPCGVP
jgi:hypothetical protein